MKGVKRGLFLYGKYRRLNGTQFGFIRDCEIVWLDNVKEWDVECGNCTLGHSANLEEAKEIADCAQARVVRIVDSRMK